MLLEVWAKTFFLIYKCLDKLAKSIDIYVNIRASSCFYKNLKSITLCSTEKVCEDITALTNKKIDLINIKHITEILLKSLPEKAARFVILKYIEEKTFEETASILEISTRTANRWNISVLEKSAKILKSLGYNNNKLLSLIGGEKWVLSVANKVIEEDKIKHSTKLTYFVILHEAEKEYKRHLI